MQLKPTRNEAEKQIHLKLAFDETPVMVKLSLQPTLLS